MIDKGKLAELWRQNLTVAQMAEILGATEDAVKQSARRMKLPKKKRGTKSILNDPQKKRWFVLNYPEMSNSTMSVYLGISEDWIGVLARRLGLKKSESYWQSINEYRHKKIITMHEAHKGDKEYYSYCARPRKNGKFIKKNN